MIGRRDILRGVAAQPLVAAPFTRAFTEVRHSLALERFVFDVRFAESGAIAEHAKRLGIRLSPVDDDLDLAWREKPMALVRRGTWSMPPFRPTEVTERDIQNIAAYLRQASGAARNGR